MQKTWGRFNRYNIETAKSSFMKKVKINNETGCWEWIGAIGSHKRYGITSIAGKHYLAHRAAYVLFNGIEPEDLCVCHKCDNGFCVNPEHLFLGTQEENVLDMEQKKRSIHPSGEKHGRSKLTWADIEPIKSAHKNGESQRSIAKRFGVATPQIRRILNGTGWVTK